MLGCAYADRPLVEVPPIVPDARGRAIAGAIVERIPDGATLQVGIGAIRNAVLGALGGHRDLGIHTELLSDGIVDLVEQGGQADFARGAMYSDGGQAFIVLHSTTNCGESRIRLHLSPGSVVTTLKNTVDHVVTEWGVASLRGRSLAERARALIAIAHPEHREALEREAAAAGMVAAPTP